MHVGRNCEKNKKEKRGPCPFSVFVFVFSRVDLLTELRDVLGSKPFKHIEQAEQVVDPTERLRTKSKNATPPLRQQLLLCVCVCVCVSRAAYLGKRSSFLAAGNSIASQSNKKRAGALRPYPLSY